MKILIAGDWHSELHEEAMFRAFQELGHKPIRFAWHHYFKVEPHASKLEYITTKFQGKYMLGSIVNKLNNDLVQKAIEEQPDILFIYRGSHIYPSTLKKIKKSIYHIKLLGYNNDDPFSPNYPKWQWRHFLACVPEYDLVFAYRLHNIPELKASGAKRVELLRSWFIPSRNYPCILNTQDKQRYECDIVFVGHYENDERVDYLKEIAKLGYNIKIWGPGYDWNSVLKKTPELKDKIPIHLVWGEEYNKSLCAAKIALCFHSKLNRDTYTRRNFGIPASGTLMLSSYSEDISNLFEEAKEAIFFKSKHEFIEKIKHYINNDQEREKIAKAGHEKVYIEKHDVNSRMKYILSKAAEISR